ncbi:MAG TPA: PKD domain-containing protein, partial [Flavobacteriales bacterium]
GYTAFPGGRSGFISSDRDGSERIYSFDLMLEPFTECTKEAPDNLCFRFQTPAGATIPGIPIHPRWDFGDGTVVEQETVEHCYERPGNYTVVLDLIDNATGNIFLKGEPRTIAAQRREQLRIGLSNAPVHGKAVELDAQRTDLKGFTPERCTWDLGDGTIMAGAVVKHSWSAPGSYNLRLDVQGMDALSGSYRSHCITRTIEVTRKGEVAENAATVTPKEFDYQELPADLFALSFLVGDDSDFHIELFASKERVGLNDARFVEVKRFYPVYERYDTERGVFSYTVGQTGDLASAYAVFKKILELHFMSAEVIMVKDEQVADLSALETLNISNLANTVIRSSTVRFANGSWAIEPSFVPQLKKIQDLLLKNPTLDIAIEAHTDAVGADDFNLELSQKRAQSIVDHLAKAGIDRERLMPIGQGENHPIADNAKEAGKALNRRVEFRLAAREEQQASQHRE